MSLILRPVEVVCDGCGRRASALDGGAAGWHGTLGREAYDHACPSCVTGAVAGLDRWHTPNPAVTVTLPFTLLQV